MTGGPVNIWWRSGGTSSPRWFAVLTFFSGCCWLGCEQSPPSAAPSVAEALPVRARAASNPALDGGRRDPAPPKSGSPLPGQELSWNFPRGPFGSTDVAISVPAATTVDQRFPVLVAFHGRGESVKGSHRGSRGWLEDYGLTRAIARLGSPPLGNQDFESFVSDERLSRFNASLREQPYAGLIIVCPFLPDVLKGAQAFAEARPLAEFVVDVLLPRVYAKTPALGSAASTGIDGVSLGGRASLLVGLSRPHAFGSVGALQAALDPKELARFAELAARALAENPGLQLRLLTSDEDYFLRENQRLSTLLDRGGVRHQLLRVPGTHSYRFNRGPGSYEMLMFHDRVLRGQPQL